MGVVQRETLKLTQGILSAGVEESELSSKSMGIVHLCMGGGGRQGEGIYGKSSVLSAMRFEKATHVANVSTVCKPTLDKWKIGIQNVVSSHKGSKLKFHVLRLYWCCCAEAKTLTIMATHTHTHTHTHTQELGVHAYFGWTLLDWVVITTRDVCDAMVVCGSRCWW